jgi:hypothetical protein
VPEEHASDEQQRRHERMAKDVNESAHRTLARERPHHADTHEIGQTHQHWTHGLADEQQRRCDRGEEHVLEHVDAEEIRREVVERRHQCEEERHEPEEEDSGAPGRPPPALHPAYASRVRRRREDGDDDR